MLTGYHPDEQGEPTDGAPMNQQKKHRRKDVYILSHPYGVCQTIPERMFYYARK